MFQKLCVQLASLPQITTLATLLHDRYVSATRSLQRLCVAPLPVAARIPFVAALATRLSDCANEHACPDIPHVMVYIVGTTEQATHAWEDLRQWYDENLIVLYPSSDALSYERLYPDQALSGQRMRVYQHLLSLHHTDQSDQPAHPTIIIAPIKALMQPTLSPDAYQEGTLPLEVGTMVSQNTLIRHCLDTGYRIVPVVEDIGQMARRGGIVDIWPIAESLPVRIEWFGDEVDSLRHFDHLSQRSDRRLERILIGPPYELAFWRRHTVMEHLVAMDTHVLREEVRAEWNASIERLEAGGRIEGWARFAPYFRHVAISSSDTNSMSSLRAYLPPQSMLLLSDASLLEQTACILHEQAEEQRAVLIESGELPPDYPRPYLLWDEVWNEQPSPHTIIDVSNQDDPDHSHPPDVTVAPPEFVAVQSFGGQIRRFVGDVVDRAYAGTHIVLATPQVARFHELIVQATNEMRAESGTAPSGRVNYVHNALTEGWHLPDLRLTIYTDTEIFGWRQRRPTPKRLRRRDTSSDDQASWVQSLKAGEHVVHIEHGIAVYEGIIRRTVDGVERDYMNLRFARQERLYVPLDQMDRVTRYVGSGDAAPRLTRLGTQEWEQAKRKARAAVQDMAEELLALYAQRTVSTGFAFSPDNDWQRDMEHGFAYIETEDQHRALNDVKRDMEQSFPMDRLVCGDVGFGKTEVAIRAAFKAVQDSKQVAVLVPTTVLAQQHYDTFRQRMQSFPVSIEMLSRFRSTKQQQEILERLSRGEVDIIVGTHRLLSNDVVFKDIGLLVIDEEQRFGVRHKERLKQLRSAVDVLTLTATPIPRTLHMALAGIRDMSVIATPPEDRVPVQTYVVPASKTLIRDVIRRECDRGGQVYYVHNRVHSIYHVADKLRKLVPEATIGIAHGQLEERELEQVMFHFFEGKYDILVCTTIIENGLDVPTVNTILIDDAPNYGLAQLYQLRGRVGRSSKRAFAYMLYQQRKPMTQDAMLRLQAIQEATELGAGFRIAMRDLEIRGAGNMLGKEQSGHIAAVGFDLYSRLLEQAVKKLRKQQREGVSNGQPPMQADTVSHAHETLKEITPHLVDEHVLVNPLATLVLPLPAYIPESYIADEALRLGLYQRMVHIRRPDEVHALRREFRDRFGELPDEARNMLNWLHVKVLAVQAGVSFISATDTEILVRLPDTTKTRERLRKQYRYHSHIQVGNQFIRLNREDVGADVWIGKLIGVLEVLGEEKR